MPETVTIIVNTDGSTEVGVECIKGTACKDATKEIERALGRTVLWRHPEVIVEDHHPAHVEQRPAHHAVGQRGAAHQQLAQAVDTLVQLPGHGAVDVLRNAPHVVPVDLEGW